MLNEFTSAAAPRADASQSPILSVIIPTFNEVRNVPILVARLSNVLKAIAWEVIFIDDDSPDGTAEVVRQLPARTRACAASAASAGGPGGRLHRGDAVVVRACRGRHGCRPPARRETAAKDAGSIESGRILSSARVRGRRQLRAGVLRRTQRGSAVATILAQRLFGVSLTDPMSGFFMIDRKAFEQVAPKLSTRGFKILLDIMASSGGGLKVAELPFVSARASTGRANSTTWWCSNTWGCCSAKLSGDRISIRFVLFALVGATGLAVHLLALQQALALSVSFDWAQTIAAFTAMTWNFFLNNQLTYRDKRL